MILQQIVFMWELDLYCLQLKRKNSTLYRTCTSMWVRLKKIIVLKSNTCLGKYSFLMGQAGEANSWHTWRNLRIRPSFLEYSFRTFSLLTGADCRRRIQGKLLFQKQDISLQNKNPSSLSHCI